MSTDLERLRTEYARRKHNNNDKALYSALNPAYLYIVQQRQRTTVQLLKRYGVSSLADKRILEVGCGRGNILLEYLGYGAQASQLVGIDLLPDRLIEGHNQGSGLSLACADGQKLPFPSAQFDIVLQYTALSSVLDPAVKRNMAAEMLRVLRKPDGCILWYDFWFNPKNRQTRGIRLSEIRQLFPGCTLDYRKITLAPPIARRLVKLSWVASLFLENLRVLNTHYHAIIRPERP